MKRQTGGSVSPVLRMYARHRTTSVGRCPQCVADRNERRRVHVDERNERDDLVDLSHLAAAGRHELSVGARTPNQILARPLHIDIALTELGRRRRHDDELRRTGLEVLQRPRRTWRMRR